MLGQALASPPDRSAALIGSALLAGCTALYMVAVVRSSFERPAVPTMIAVTAATPAVTSAGTPVRTAHLAPMTPDLNRPLAQYLAVATEIDMALLYHALINQTPTADNYEQWAASLSYEYRVESDAFKKERLLQSIAEPLQARYQAYQQSRYISIEQPFTLEPYDLTTHTFPLSATLGSDLNWLYNGRLPYILPHETTVLMIANAAHFAHYELTGEVAVRFIEAQIGMPRTGQGRVYLFIKDVNPTAHQIDAEIIRVQLQDHKGRDVGQIGAQGR